MDLHRNFFIAYIENIFPPIPSDLVIVFGGSLTGIDRIDFGLTLLFATLGSMLGFATMYSIGYRFGKNIVETGKFKFISPESITEVKSWFHSYGYWLIVGNRFLPGSRAVISFFAGFSHLKVLLTFSLCFLSALLWNGTLVYAGNILGHNWQQIGFYLPILKQSQLYFSFSFCFCSAGIFTEKIKRLQSDARFFILYRQKSFLFI